MPSKRPKAKAGAEAAPRLPRLPDELWDKIFFDVAERDDADLATLRLVNKLCAKTFASRQCRKTIKDTLLRKQLARREEVAEATATINGTDQATLGRIEALQSYCQGEVMGDIRLERFIWELCSAYRERKRSARRRSKRQKQLAERTIIVEASIDALRASGY